MTADNTRARRAVGLALFAVASIGPLLAALSYAFLVDIPGLSEAAPGVSGRAAAIVLAAGVISALAGPYRGFALARGGISAIATARALCSTTQLAVTAAGVFLSKSLLAPAVGYMAGALLELFLSWRAASALDPALPRAPHLPRDLREITGSLRDGAAALTIGVACALTIRADIFILSRVAPLATVAAFGVASRAIDVSYVLAKQSTVALMPRLGDPARREVAVRVGVGLFGGIVAAGMTALAIAGQPLLVAWVGPVAAGPVTATALALLAAAAIVQASSEVPASMLTLGARTAWASALPIAAGAAVKFILSASGAPQYGVLAVAGSTVIGSALTTVILWRKASRMLGWGAASIARALAPPLACGAAAAAVAASLSGHARGALLSSAAVCAAAVFFGLAVLVVMWRHGWKPRATA